MATTRSLHTGFVCASKRFPDRAALRIGEEETSYAELRAQAEKIAQLLVTSRPSTAPKQTAIYAHRSLAAYSGILAALFSGNAYVPLNPDYPPERCLHMLQRAGCKSIVWDQAGCRHLEYVLDNIEYSLCLILPEQDSISEFANRWPTHEFYSAKDIDSARRLSPVESQDDDEMAYLLFTSGSTGVPKGVMVSHGNVNHFVDVMVSRYEFCETDRFSQTFDLTFDLSVFDMFCAWQVGGCVCCPTRQQKMLPGRYVTDSELTVWFSVPSTGILMQKLRMLKPNQYPKLRLSLFCGEALPVDLMETWSKSAPNSILENLYGPTELTIACTAYRWDPELTPRESELGLVPIGEAFTGMRAVIVDDSLQEVPVGTAGELLMTGPQLALGYWQDEEKTRAAFTEIPGHEGIFYRTGDRVNQRKSGGEMVYLGRLDNQIKVQGYRVELAEIEAVLRRVARVNTAIAIGWPVTGGSAESIVAFIDKYDFELDEVMQKVKSELPGYMVPKRIVGLQKFPLNSNGKVDRNELAAMLAESNDKPNTE